MGVSGNFLGTVEAALYRKHAVEAIFISTLMLLVYDWLLMLPQEVKYIWRASWNYTKVLYLLIRYIPFAALSLLIRNQFASGATPYSCKLALQAACWTGSLGVDLSEVILAIRTYAVWNKDRRVGIGLALLLIVCQIPNAIFVERFIEMIEFVDNPYSDIYRGCLAISGTNIIYINWVVFTILEGVVLGLMVISALQTYRRDTSIFLHVIYVHGMLFYVYMFLVTAANIVITVIMPIDFVGIGSSIEIVLHSNLACRLVIGIREASRLTVRKSEVFELSGTSVDETVVFARSNRESGWVDLEARPEPPKS